MTKFVHDNKNKIEKAKIDNMEIIKQKEHLNQKGYELAQTSKQLYLKIKRTRYLIDDMRSSYDTYNDLY